MLDTPLEQVLPLIETPPDPALGDYALPCFAFAKTLRKAPQLIAKSIVESAMPACVVKAEVAGGYANFTVDKALYARTVLDQALLEGERYGAQDIGHGRTVCIDYSSINIAKTVPYRPPFPARPLDMPCTISTISWATRA